MSRTPAHAVRHDGSPPTLDQAIEHVLLVLESDQRIDREKLLAEFPQWADDLTQFIDNWLAMEQRTATLIENPSVESYFKSHCQKGKVIGDFELLEPISLGGMGVVFRAKQISLGRIVALKMLLNSVRDKMRFRIEAEAAASLHHANIVAIHEVGEFEGQPFLSMQYIAGGNLQDHLKSGGMSPRTAAILVRTIANAVHYAHQRGILHRDLKPSNVLLDPDGRPFVSDFGLAKQIGNSAELTRSGAVLGTPGYMAPEQAMGQVKSITVAADVYGLGAILYAALTGNAPFKSDSDLLTLRKVIEESPVSPRALRPELDRNLENICLKCLEKSPSARYSSARQLAEDLTRYLHGEPVVARPIGFFERRWRWCQRNPSLAIISFFAGLMVAAVVFLCLGFGWREYVARMNAEFASIREAAMKEAVDVARGDADRKNLIAQQAVANLYTTNGLWAASTDLHGESLLWFARAAQLEDIPKPMIDDSRVRCLSWLSQSPVPIAAHQLPAHLKEPTFQSDWSNWHLSPNRTEIMFKSGDQFGIWNIKTDEVWQPGGRDFQVNSAVWSNDGYLIALGGVNGELRVLDATNKATKAAISMDSRIECLAFSNSGKQLVVGTHNLISVVNSHNLNSEDVWTIQASPRRLKFSSDDSKLSMVSSDAKVRILEFTEAGPRQNMETACFLPKEKSYHHSFGPEFTKDGSKLFVRTNERRARFFDSYSGQPLSEDFSTGTTFSAALANDLSSCVFGGDSYARIQSIKWRSNEVSLVRHQCRLSHDDAITSIAYGGKKLIATAGRDRIVHLWRVSDESSPGRFFNEREKPLASLVHSDDLAGLLFSNDGNQLTTVQRDGQIRVWQIPSFETTGYAIRMPRGGSTLKLVGKDSILVSGSTHRHSNVINASLRRLKDGVVLSETPLNDLRDQGHLLDAAYVQDRDELITLHANPRRSVSTLITQDQTAGSIQFWQFSRGLPSGPGINVKAEPRSAALHPIEPTAAVLLANGDVLRVDLTKRVVAGVLSANVNSGDSSQPVDTQLGNLRNGQIAFSPNGVLLYQWGIGKGFRVWNFKAQQLQFATEFADKWTVRHLAVSPIGTQAVAALDESNRMVLIDCKEGKLLREMEMSDRIRSIEFSTTGKELIVACDEFRARIIPVDGDDRRSFDLVHEKTVLDACFSPDGKSIATLCSDMQVSLWRIGDRKLVIKPMPVPPGTQEILFSHDSQFIVAMGIGIKDVTSSELRVLDLSTFHWENQFDLKLVSLLGELLSSKSIGDGVSTGLSSAEWLERWQTYRANR
ncbi:MAG: serine/threonine-protein kinase [Pirellulales bacterium]